MPLVALPNELLCLIADSLRSEDLCSTMETRKEIRDALLAKHWRRAATWAASRRFSLDPAERTEEGEAELRRSLSILSYCSSYLDSKEADSKEAVECDIIIALIAEATGCRRLAKDNHGNSPLANFSETSLQPPLQFSCEVVVVGHLYAAAKFGAQTVIRYLRPDPFCDEKHSIALANALSIAVTHNDIFAAEQLIEHGASSGGSVSCVELQVGGRTYRPPRGCISQLCIAVLHEHEEMVRFICEDMCQEGCLFELWGGLDVARKYKLDKLEKFLGEVYNWHLVNSPGVKYNLEREGLTIDIPRPW